MAIFVINEVALSNHSPHQIILTWQQKPRTTMTITWRAQVQNLKKVESVIKYSNVESTKEKGRKKKAETFSFDETDSWLHTVELTGLNPGSRYSAKVETNGAESEEFFFETIPEQGQQVTFIAGGDSRTDRDSRRMINKKVASERPDFVLFDGDLITDPMSASQWNDWFEDWDELLVTKEGRRIPIVPAIGNHEVVGEYSQEKKDAPFYYQRFILPGNEKYYTLDFGSFTVLTMDSGHTSSINGKQKTWLKRNLENIGKNETIVLQYHVPAWPSTGNPYTGLHGEIIKHWVPIFEENDVDLVSEAHEHNYKQTYPLFGTSRINSKFQEAIQTGIEKARKKFDSNKDYSPWSNKKLQKLSKGEYKEIGYKDVLTAMEALCLEYSLYAKQQSKLTVEYVRDLVTSSKLYSKYWENITQSSGFSDLTRPGKGKGVVFIGDGSWGAPTGRNIPYGNMVDKGKWWLKKAGIFFNYWEISVIPKNGKMEAVPHLYSKEKRKWFEGQKILIQIDD